MAAKTIVVRQTGSAIRRKKEQKRTLDCLGLGRIGRERTHEASPSIIGMVKKVKHLVTVRYAND